MNKTKGCLIANFATVPGKVLVLRKGDIEIPSDLAGVLYTELDEHGGWKRKLLSELAYAGVPFDKDKALSA